MREHLKFGLIKTEEEFKELQRFAQSFDHEVGRDAIPPIFTIERGEHMVGYYNVIQHPIVCPAMNPAVTTPREFFETLMFLKNHYCLNSINGKFPHGMGLMAVQTKLPQHLKNAFERAGFRNTKKEIWQALP